jgi:hypothetical protein
MVGTIFRKHIERHEMGTPGNNSMYQTWKVVADLGDGIYSCVRVDNTQDPLGAASPQKRTFKGVDIQKYLKNKQ